MFPQAMGKKEPWTKFGMDLFQVKDEDYLILIDYHSNYPEFCQLSSTTAENVIAHTKGHIHTTGLLLQSQVTMDLHSTASAYRGLGWWFETHTVSLNRSVTETPGPRGDCLDQMGWTVRALVKVIKVTTDQLTRTVYLHYIRYIRCLGN